MARQRQADRTLTRAVDRHGAGVYTVALQVTGDPHVAVDISGRVFADLARDGGQPTAAQLLREAHRLALAHARRHGRPTDRPNIFAGLAADDAWLLHAAYVEGRTYREIAEVLDVAPTQAAAMIRSALHRQRR